MLLAHSGETTTIVAETSSTLPTYGTIETATFGFILILVALAIIYFFIGRIPKSKRFSLTPNKEILLARLVTTFVLGAMLAAGWDIWWHRAVGRDSLFQEPHLFLYSFALLAIISSIIGWIGTHKKAWKKIATVLILIPATAPFDNLWHLMFGVEDLSNPVALAWSPPHMLLDIGGLLALSFLIPVLMKDQKEPRRSFFIDIAFGAILAQVLFLFLPFHPTEGWGQVLGFWGAGLMMFAFVGVLTYARSKLNGQFDTTRIVIYYLLILLVGYGEETAPNIILLPHDRQALWLVILPYLISAIFLDLSAKKLPDYLRGAIAGGLWASLLFFTTPSFAEPGFGYPLINALYATISCMIGGGLGIIFVKKILGQKN